MMSNLGSFFEVKLSYWESVLLKQFFILVVLLLLLMHKLLDLSPF